MHFRYKTLLLPLLQSNVIELIELQQSDGRIFNLETFT